MVMEDDMLLGGIKEAYNAAALWMKGEIKHESAGEGRGRSGVRHCL